MGGGGPGRQPALARFQGPTPAKPGARRQAEVGGPSPLVQEWRAVVVALGLLLLSVAGHLNPGWHAARVAAWCPLIPPPLVGPASPCFGAGAPDPGARAPAGGPWAASMEHPGGPGDWVVPTWPAWVAFLWPAGGWALFLSTGLMLAGFVLLGRFLEERARFRRPVALSQLAELQPIPPCSARRWPARRCRWAGCAPGPAAPAPKRDRIPVDWLAVVARWLLGRDALELPRRNPCRWRPSPATGFCRPACLKSSGPLVAGGAPAGAKRPWPGVHRPRRSRPRRARRRSRPRRPVLRPFRRVVLLPGPGHRLFSGGVGHQVVGPRCWPAAPRRHGGMAGNAVLGAVAAYGLFHGGFNWRLPCSWLACPCALGLGPRPRANSPWERAWAGLAPACCSAVGDCDRD